MLSAASPLCFSWDHEGIAMRRAIAKPSWICFGTLPIWGLNASSAARSPLWIDFVRKSTTQPFSRILLPRHRSSQCSSQRGFQQEGQENYKRTSSKGFATLDSSAIFVGRGTNPKSSQRQNCDPRRHWRGNARQSANQILLYLWRRLRGDKLTRALSYKAKLPRCGALGSATMPRSAARAGSQRTLSLRFDWSNFLARREFASQTAKFFSGLAVRRGVHMASNHPRILSKRSDRPPRL